MEDIPFLDQSTVTSSDRLCFMILDHLKRLEDNLDEFRKEYIDAKRIEKYNELAKIVMDFIDHEHDGKYRIEYKYDEKEVMVFECGAETQLVISMCIKKLSRERILSIWEKIFPDKNITDLLNYWEEECNIDSFHVVWGFDHDTRDYEAHCRALETKSYGEEDVRKLLNELTLAEIVDITPVIEEVTYMPIQI